MDAGPGRKERLSGPGVDETKPGETEQLSGVGADEAEGSNYLDLD